MPTQRIDWIRNTDDWGFFRHSSSFSGISDPVIVNSTMHKLSASVHPAGGQTARIEFTLSTPAMVDAGTARWIAWDLGDMNRSAADALLSPITALRAVTSGGTAVLEIVAI